ncbi:hypothetical protein BGZ72_002275 [Mortierella alpina]|nr:hypothetical protein BGZ72_002275 [Mortierella alpina]
MWAPSYKVVRILQNWMVRLVVTSIILFVASHTLRGRANVIQYSRIIITVAVGVFLCYKYTKLNSIQHTLRIMLMCLSSIFAALLLFYAGTLISIAQAQEDIIMYIAGGFDVAIGVLLIIDGVFTELYIRHVHSKGVPPPRNNNSVHSGQEAHASGTPQEPLPVHLYRPRLSLTPNERTSMHSGSRVPTEDDMEAAQQDDDAVELEELPKYERTRPVQHATIVDMANLQSVDAAVLRTAIPLSPSNTSHNDGSGLEQGQESRLELGAISTAEAPQYLPSLVEVPAETLAPLASSAPTYDLSAQLSSATSSRSSVVLTMPLSDAPAALPPTAANTVAPSITVTSAPPVYSP